MTTDVIVMTGPARSGKTERMLAEYREALGERVPQSTLWLAPTWRAAAAVRDRLMDGRLDACFSPGVMTFDQFAEAVVKVSPGPVRPLSRLMKRQLVRLLLDEQLKAGRIRHFLPIACTGGLVDQICELISELKRLDVWPDRFAEACRSRGMTEKDAESAAVYASYQQVLNEHQLYDAEGRFWWARTLLREGQRRPFERLRLVVVDGFADFTPPQHEILEILAGRVERLRITLPLSAEPPRADLFGKSLGTLAELRRRHPRLNQQPLDRPPASNPWPGMHHLEQHLFGNPRAAQRAPDTSRIEILAASRQLGEIELIGSRIKRLLTSGSEQTGGRPVRPGDVAVVFRSLGEVEGLVREVFGRLGIPFALESRPALGRSPALGALVGLVRLDVEDWPFDQLIALLANNYFQPDWPEWQGGLAAVAAEQTIRSFQIPRGRKRLVEQLRRAADRPAPEHGAWHRDAEEQSRRAQLALPLILRLEEVFAELPERATLGGWADAWRELAGQTGLLRVIERDRSTAEGEAGRDRCNNPQTAVPDHVAWPCLREALVGHDRLARLVGRTPRTLDRRKALAALVDAVHSTTVDERVDESGRVRILSAPGARTLRIPYLFFAGLAERSFPLPERRDRLYGEAEYRCLIDAGLPLVGRAEQSGEEMLLFYEVVTRAQERLAFSYPALDETAQPLSPSPYLEEVEQACGVGRITRTEAADLSPIPTDGDPLTPAAFRVRAVWEALDGDASLLAALVRREPEPGLADNVLAGLEMVEARRDRQQFGPAEGILQSAAARREVAARFGPMRAFTATELEQYACCPYQFFAERVLGLVPPEDLGLSVDYLARGQLVHAALADFHRRVNASRGRPTSPADLDDDHYERLLQETLDRLWAEAPEGPLDAALRQIDRRLWIRWCHEYRDQHRGYDHQWRDCQAPLRPTWFEVSFGRGRDGPGPPSTDRPLELPAGEEVIRIAGRVDRIDTGEVAGRTVFNVVDYKTGTSTRLSRRTATGQTAFQLPLYAMATEQILLADEHAIPWQAGYWYVQDRGFNPRQSLKMHACRDGKLEPEPEWVALRTAIVARVGALVPGIREGRFPVFSADEDCTRFCPFRTICRISHVRSLEKTWVPASEEN